MNKKELITEYRTFKEDKKNNTISFDVLPLTDAGKGSDKYLCDYSFVFEFIRSLTGEMLTIVDATIPQGVQNKCTKDLVRKSFSNKLQLISELLIDLEDCDRQLDEHLANGGKLCKSVDIDDIISGDFEAEEI